MTFKIAEGYCTLEDWASALEIFRESNSLMRGQDDADALVEEISADNDITESEITSFLDVNGDHIVTPSDFGSLNVDIFNDLEELLSTHRYDLVPRIATDIYYQHQVPDFFWENERFLLFVLRQDGDKLRYAPEEMRNDEMIAFTAVRQEGHAMCYVSRRLQRNRTFVLDAVNINGRALEYASSTLRNDREIVLAAVKEDGTALHFASGRLRADREIVLEAVRNAGNALQFASQRLLSDPEIVLEAISQDEYAFRLASEELQNDREFIVEAISRNGLLLMILPDELRTDRDIVKTAVNEDGMILQNVFPEFQNDREIVLAAVTQRGDAIWFASQELRSDPEILSAALVDKFMREGSLYFIKAMVRLVPQGSLEEVATLCIDQIQASGAILPPQIDDAQKIDLLVRDLEDLDIDFPERMTSLETLSTIVANRRRTVVTADEPIALFVTTKVDPNGAAAYYPSVEKFVQNGFYNVLYFEAGTEDDVVRIINDVHDQYRRPIDSIVFEWHGNRRGSLSGRLGSASTFFGLPSMPTDQIASAIGENLAPDGQVILLSCFGGRGGSNEENFANSVASVLPQDSTVMSLVEAANITFLSIGINGRIFIETSYGQIYTTPGRL